MGQGNTGFDFWPVLILEAGMAPCSPLLTSHVALPENKPTELQHWLGHALTAGSLAVEARWSSELGCPSGAIDLAVAVCGLP